MKMDKMGHFNNNKRNWFTCYAYLERWILMLDFTWKVFSKTGSIETYLLLKEMEKDLNDEMDQHEEELAHLDSPIS